MLQGGWYLPARLAYLRLLRVIAIGALCAPVVAVPLCPSTHLSPSADYGRAFASAEALTINFQYPLAPSEESVFEYFEYQTADPGFAPVYAIHVFSAGSRSQGRAVLARLRSGKVVTDEAPLSESELLQLLTFARPIVLATRYPADTCKVLHTDGFVVQAGLLDGGDGMKAGEAYTPVPESQAEEIVRLGRAIKDHVLGKSSINRFLMSKPDA